MIKGLHHTALAVPDIDQALAFYCDVLGFESGMHADIPGGLLEEPFDIERAGCRVRMIHKGGTAIELFEFEHPEPGEPRRPVNRVGITHIALASDDVPADVATLEAAGVVFHSEIQGESPLQWCYGRDPFGNVIEVIEATEATEATKG
jgi:glyoxylase I family protein